MPDDIQKNCWCWSCRKDIPVYDVAQGPLSGRIITEGMTRMFLCPECGNKRCPRATDHRESCTGSNEPDQQGSRYGVYPNPNRPLFDFFQGKKNDTT